MKLKSIIASFPAGRVVTGHPIMTISPSYGMVSFNQTSVSKYGIDTNTTIDLLQDEERPKDWYVHFQANGTSKSGVYGRFDKHGKRVIIQNTALARHLIRLLNLDVTTTYSMLLGEPVQQDVATYVPIITASIKPIIK